MEWTRCDEMCHEAMTSNLRGLVSTVSVIP